MEGYNMKKYIASALAATALFTSCHHDSELENTIWIDSDTHPGLPEYTEWGYNTFGAYINNETFTSGEWYSYTLDDNVIKSGNDTLTFNLTGPSEINKVKRLEFSFPFKHLQWYEDLAELDKVKIDLAKTDVIVNMTICYDYEKDTTFTMMVDKGELFFKRVQRIHLNNRLKEVALSGIFSLAGEFTDDSGTKKRCKIEEGRFDLGINSRNFSDIITK